MANKRISYHFDEHIPHAVAKALRQYGVDVSTSIEAGLHQADDSAHLEYARLAGRVIVTFDADFLQFHATGVEHAGIAYIRPNSRSIGNLIEMLRLFYELFLADEMTNRLEYL